MILPGRRMCPIFALNMQMMYHMKTVSILFPCLIALLLTSCGGPGKPSSDDTAKTDPAGTGRIAPEYTVVSSPTVDLSRFPTDTDGYITLFDGKSLDGWRGYARDYLPGKWRIDGNTLMLFRSGTGEETEGGTIIFAHRFRNFRLELDWKISKDGNSGIFYLAQEIQTKDMQTGETKMQSIIISAPEYQILDNENHPDAELGENGNRKSASLYDMIPAEPQNARPFGEWNQCAITVHNGVVTHSQNGVDVVRYELWTPQWIATLQNSKFSEEAWPLAFELMSHCGGPAHEGYIGLQDHGYDVWYRNIRIKILD